MTKTNRINSLKWVFCWSFQGCECNDTIWKLCRRRIQGRRKQKSSRVASDEATLNDAHDLLALPNIRFSRRKQGRKEIKRGMELQDVERIEIRRKSKRANEWLVFPIWDISRFSKPIHTTITLISIKQTRRSRIRAGFRTDRMMFVCLQNTEKNEKRALRTIKWYLFP